MAELDTFPKLMRRNYEKWGDRKVAMRRKDWGIWLKYDWKVYYENVKHFCGGLLSLGLKRGDRITIQGENDPEYYWAELAANAAGGAAVGVFSDCLPEELKYYVLDSGSTFVVSEDMEQTDKALLVKDEITPQVKKVIYWDPKGMYRYREDPFVMNFYDVVELGKKYEQEHPGFFEKLIDETKADDVAALCYTSGTTGVPKGVVMSHKMLLGLADAVRIINPMDPDWQYLSYIPPAWLTEQFLGIGTCLVTGVVVNFPEKPETVQQNIREVGAQVLFYGARLWEDVSRAIQAKIADTSREKKLLYDLSLPVGYKMADMRLGKKSISPFWKALHFLCDQAVFRPLRDQMGLMKVKVAYMAGAAMAPESIKLLHAFGVPLKVIYGTSECTNCIHWDDDIDPETAAPPCPRAEVRISEEGEIQLKADYMFSGYWGKEELYKKVIKDGYFCTGDAGYITEDGHLVFLDRMKELIPLSSGRKFAPQAIEIRLRFSPFVRDAMALGGEDRDYVSAIIIIDFANVGKWAETNHIAYTTFTDLSQKDRVAELILRDVARVNRVMPEWSRIKKYVLLHKEFDPDEAELTRTRKLRRSFMEDRYRDLISGIYEDKAAVPVEASITYQDGRKGTIKTDLKVRSAEGK